jgi:hypothetical protein
LIILIMNPHLGQLFHGELAARLQQQLHSRRPVLQAAAAAAAAATAASLKPGTSTPVANTILAVYTQKLL